MPRNSLCVLSGFLLTSIVCLAQGRTERIGSANGFGSVAFPGLGHPPGASSAPRRLGSTDGTYSWRPYVNRGRRTGVAAYPVYVGGFGDYYGGYGAGYDQPAEPNVTIVNAPPAAPAPPVIINQYFGAPPPQGEEPSDGTVHFYSDNGKSGNETAAAPAAEPRTYLIAYKDHSVYSALAYWLEDKTLNYVTPQNTHNQADLSLIDLDFTRKLNADRSMPFSLNR